MEVLRKDPDLGGGLSAAGLERAQRECTAEQRQINRGTWDPHALQLDPNGYGLLVISGYVVRKVGQQGRFGAELLGCGDLLRPWQEGGGESLPFEPRWNAITPVEVAILDTDFAHRAAAFPAIGIQLVDRVMLRSRYLAITMAIVHQPRVDQRLHLLLWHYADRWGRVGPSGVTIDVPLTHRLLAELVGARRPTVTTGLASLAGEGKVLKSDGCWCLPGGAPRELDEITRSVSGSAEAVTDSALGAA